MKAYSVDLRQRVLDALERGMSRTEAVTTFQVSEGSIKRWRKLQRERKALAGSTPPGRRATITVNAEAVVRRLVAATPDATLAEYTRQWNALHDTPISQWTFGRAVRRLKLTRKKKSDRPRT